MEFEKICEIIGKQLDIDPKTITMIIILSSQIIRYD